MWFPSDPFWLSSNWEAVSHFSTLGGTDVCGIHSIRDCQAALKKERKHFKFFINQFYPLTNWVNLWQIIYFENDQNGRKYESILLINILHCEAIELKTIGRFAHLFCAHKLATRAEEQYKVRWCRLVFNKPVSGPSLELKRLKQMTPCEASRAAGCPRQSTKKGQLQCLKSSSSEQYN